MFGTLMSRSLPRHSKVKTDIYMAFFFFKFIFKEKKPIRTYHIFIFQKSYNSKNKQSSIMVLAFVWFDSLCLSQQFFSYVAMGLPRLNQYKAKINVSCSRT